MVQGLTGLYVHITREQMGLWTRYMEDQRGQPCRDFSTGKFISHQNPMILDKRRILDVSRQLSSKSDENVSAQQINCNLDSFFNFFLNM